jgi:hypothetical protein
MQAASADISALGFELDLMWHRVLTRMRRRSTTRSVGASVSLAEDGSWTGGRGSTAVASLLRRVRGRERRRWKPERLQQVEDEGEWGLPRPGSPYL